MNIVKEGDTVQFVCELKSEDGTVYYRNDEKNVLEFTIGEGKFFPAVERKMKDMKEGETKTLIIEPKDAFGMHKSDLVVEVPKNDFGSDETLDVGSRVKIKTPSGETVYGTIVEITNEKFIVDFNHPLAGLNVVFSITITSVEKKSKTKK